MTINIASKRVIEKCSFTYKDTLRDSSFIDDKYIERLYYSILKNDFEK